MSNNICELKKIEDYYYTVRGHKYIDIKNNPRNICEFYFFQLFLEALIQSKGSVNTNPKKKPEEPASMQQTAIIKSDRFAIDVNVEIPEAKPSGSSSPSVVLFFSDKALQDLYERLNKKEDKKEVLISALEVTLRSPERMVRFLGDVIAVQELAQNGENLEIRVGGDIVDLFRAERGSESRAAVAVVGPEGERFAIPIPDHSLPSRHRSLPALALVMDFINSAVSGESLPAPNTVILSGS